MPLRPLLAAGVVVFILGSVYAYTLFLGHLKARAQNEARAREQEVKAAAEGRFEVEVTPTFASEPDAFSAEATPASLTVRLAGSGGAILLRRTDAVPAGMPIRVAAPGVAVGKNVFAVEASPRLADLGNAAALHIRILRNGSPIAEKTLWADAGERLSGSIEIDVAPLPGSDHPE